MGKDKGTCGECEHRFDCTKEQHDSECPARTSEKKLRQELEEMQNATEPFNAVSRKLCYDENEKLRKVLRALTKKLTAMENSSALAAVFSSAWAHGVNYDGPNWKEELQQARKLLGNICLVCGKKRLPGEACCSRCSNVSLESCDRCGGEGESTLPCPLCGVIKKTKTCKHCGGTREVHYRYDDPLAEATVEATEPCIHCGAKKSECSLCGDSKIVEVHDKNTGEFISTTDCPQCVGKETPMDELMKALKPFAEMPDYHDLEDDVVVFGPDGGKAITAGDVRRAQEAYRVHLERIKFGTPDQIQTVEEVRYCLEYIDEIIDITNDDIKLKIWKRLGRLMRGLITERDRIREVLKVCRNCAEPDCTKVSDGLGCNLLERENQGDLHEALPTGERMVGKAPTVCGNCGHDVLLTKADHVPAGTLVCARCGAEA